MDGTAILSVIDRKLAIHPEAMRRYVDKKKLQNLCMERLEDVEALLEARRWSGAYYLCGYVIECALKACLLRHLGESGSIFDDPTYLKKLTECWRHDLTKLEKLAGLEAEFGSARSLNESLSNYWLVTKDWKATSRYQEMTEIQARALHEAVSHHPDGVFLWIQSGW